jgi:hypothetical protein
MAENELGIGDIVIPRAETERDINLKIALEGFANKVRDNIDYLLRPRIVSATTTYTATDLDHSIICDASGGGFTVTLPAVGLSEGLLLNIKKIDSSAYAVTIDGSGSETIDDNTTISISDQYTSYNLHCDGSEWYIIADYVMPSGGLPS